MNDPMHGSDIPAKSGLNFLFVAMILSCTAIAGCAAWDWLPWSRQSRMVSPPLKPQVVIHWEDLPSDSLLSDYDLFTYPQIHSPWVDSLMQTLSLSERVAQMVVPFTFSDAEGRKLSEIKSHVIEQRVGGVILSKGSVKSAAKLIDSLQSWASVPLLISADFENGLAMRLTGATEFPSMMALGATGNPDYAYAMGRVIAAEMRGLGVQQNYAPVADVNNNPENPIINVRSFGEDPQLVASMAEAYMRGLQDGRVVATAKHFPGHGDSEVDSHTDLPVIRTTLGRLDSVELYPFRRLVSSGILSVMTGHLAVPVIDADSSRPATLSRGVLDSLLREVYGFKGLLVTDAMNMQALAKRYRSGSAAKLAVLAGADIILMPTGIAETIDSIVEAVKRKEIPEEEINRSVRRILSYKQWLGLVEQRRPENRQRLGIGSDIHRALSARIARNAVTLVRNDSGYLPLPASLPGKTVCVGLLHNKDASESEAFTVELSKRIPQLRSMTAERSLPEKQRKRIMDSLQSADLIIIASHINVRTASGRITVSKGQQTLLDHIAALNKRVILISLGSPYILSAAPWVSAYLCTYGSEEPMRQAAIDALFGDISPKGALPVSIPGLARRGSGLRYPPLPQFADAIAAPVLSSSRFHLVDSLIEQQMRQRAFPGAQLVVLKDEAIVHARPYGTLSYDTASPAVTMETLYDLASLTKIVATTTAAMKLYDEQQLDLDSPVVGYLPSFARAGKERISVRNLLLHDSGLPAFKPLYRTCVDSTQAIDAVFASPLDYPTGSRTVYSDFGMIALGKVIERITRMPLDDYVRQRFFEPLQMSRTMFRPASSLRLNIAPTELDTVWRKRLVHGTVHDETAALLGGVAGHAGLFSTATDLARFAEMIMNGGSANGRRYFQPETVRLFTRRAAPASTRALGWDTRSSTGSSAGRYFSLKSFGHTGFTGTSIWFDPDARICVIFLTNRVHPTRENKKLISFRAVLHDAIREALAELK